MVLDTFELPYGTHRFILKEISGLKPLQVNLEDRFRKFCSNLRKSDRPEVNFLFNTQRYDCRSTFGRNCRNIALCRKRDIYYSEKTSTLEFFFTYLVIKIIHEIYITWKMMIWSFSIIFFKIFFFVFYRKFRSWK